MFFNSSFLDAPSAIGTVVVRPRDECGSGSTQTLVFLKNEIRELLQTSKDGVGSQSAGMSSVQTREHFQLSDQPLPVAGVIGTVHCAIYEPTSDCIYYVKDEVTLMRLDRNNTVHLAAGDPRSKVPCDRVDGFGESVRFKYITSIAADGKGHIFVAESYTEFTEGDSRIRVVRVRTGEVFTLHDSGAPAPDYWTALTYDSVRDVLVAATATTVWLAVPYGNLQPSWVHGDAAAYMRLMAGYPGDSCRQDGLKKQARFRNVRSLIAGAFGRLWLSDGGVLRTMDADGRVSTTRQGFEVPGMRITVLPGGDLVPGMRITVLPGGELVGVTNATSPPNTRLYITTKANVKPCSEVLAGWRRFSAASPPQLHELLGRGLAEHDTSGGGGGASSLIVTVRVSGGQAYAAHRAVLSARSDYFKQLLQPGGGFVDSGTDEVSIPDAHADAFVRLLSYMYGGALDVPIELLRPATELAGRLLMPPDCLDELERQVLARVTPGSVVSDLMWAEQHNLAGLVAQLKTFVREHRAQVVATATEARQELAALAKLNPELAADFMLSLLTNGV